MSEEFEQKATDLSEEAGADEQMAGDDVVVTEKKPMSRGMLIVAGLLLLGGAVIFTMYKKKGPAAAEASIDTSAQQTIDTFLSSRENGVQKMQLLLRNTEKLVAQFLSYPTAAQVPLSDLQTNPFRTFGAGTPGDEDGAGKKKREQERLAVIKAVQELQLQSVIHSESRRACMINNTLYLEGQQVNVFTIEKISPKAVVVKSGAYRFELKMEK